MHANQGGCKLKAFTLDAGSTSLATSGKKAVYMQASSSTPLRKSQMPSNKDHKTLDGGTLGVQADTYQAAHLI